MDVSRIEYMRRNHPGMVNAAGDGVPCPVGVKVNDHMRHVVALTQPWAEVNQSEPIVYVWEVDLVDVEVDA